MTSPASPTTSYTDLGETTKHTLVAKEGETGAIRTIDTVTFSCSENSAITMVTLEGIPGAFAEFTSLTITTDKDKPLKFSSVGGIATADLRDKPFEFVAGTFDISGDIPGSAAIITVTYDTVNDGACKYQKPS